MFFERDFIKEDQSEGVLCKQFLRGYLESFTCKFAAMEEPASPPHLSPDDDVPLVIPDGTSLESTTATSSLFDFNTLTPLPPETLGIHFDPPMATSDQKSHHRPPLAPLKVKTHKRNATKKYGQCLTDTIYQLPDGWRKQCVQRKTGASAGGWDVYVLPPKGGKLRSNSDILRFVRDNPSIPINPELVNMERPIDKHGKCPMTPKIRSLEEALRIVQSTGQMPEKGTLRNVSHLTKSYARNHHIKLSPNNGHRNLFTTEQVMALESHFASAIVSPSEDQVNIWADELHLERDAVKAWFLSRWKAKLEYEASLNCEIVYEGTTSRRPVKFDIDSSTLCEPQDSSTQENYEIVIDLDDEDYECVEPEVEIVTEDDSLEEIEIDEHNVEDDF